MISDLHKKRREGLESYISVYQQQMANLEELMVLHMEMDTEELDKAWNGISTDK